MRPMHSDKKEVSVWLQARLLCSYQIAVSFFQVLANAVLGIYAYSLPQGGIGGLLANLLFCLFGAWLCIRYLARNYLLHRSRAAKIILVSLLILPVFFGLLLGAVLAYTSFLPAESAAQIYAPLSASWSIMSTWQWWLRALLTQSVYFAVTWYLYRRTAQVA
jgi:hypothetical protein